MGADGKGGPSRGERLLAGPSIYPVIAGGGDGRWGRSERRLGAGIAGCFRWSRVFLYFTTDSVLAGMSVCSEVREMSPWKRGMVWDD